MSQVSTEPVTHDVAFDLLSNARRRFVLRRLQTAEAGVELSSLARELAAYENDTDPDALTTDQRKRAYVSLYQTHVPKLEEAGILTYDHDTGVVRATDHLEELTAYFRSGGERPPWRSLYFAFCAGGVAAFGLAYVIDVRAVPPLMVGLSVLFAISVLTGVYYLSERRRGRRRVRIPVSRG